ncbi:MAG: hypothetical protein AAF226_14395 [Verrucomicrobiota bacterium]
MKSFSGLKGLPRDAFERLILNSVTKGLIQCRAATFYSLAVGFNPRLATGFSVRRVATANAEKHATQNEQSLRDKTPYSHA